MPRRHLVGFGLLVCKFTLQVDLLALPSTHKVWLANAAWASR